jgi:hypothetical protein
VTVSIHAANGEIIEEGDAVLDERTSTGDTLLLSPTTTFVGSTVTATATATDTPGNKGPLVTIL